MAQTEKEQGKSETLLGGYEPFEIYDPSTEDWLSFRALDEIIAKANELNVGTFTVYGGGGRQTRVNQINGEWIPEDGQELGELEYYNSENMMAMLEKETHKTAEMESMLSEDLNNPLAEDGPENSMARAVVPSSMAMSAATSPDSAAQPYTRPTKLLGGKFVGNDKGEYRRVGEKNIALIDADEKIKFKDRKFDTFQAGAELAKAKGWQAIEVTGTERFRREAWFYAKLQGLEVVGFEPNKKDIERLGSAQKEQGVRSAELPVDAARMSTFKEAENEVLRRSGGLQKDERGDSRCIGPVIFQNENYAVQNVGREIYRIHDKDQLDDKSLHKLVSSKVVEIKYERGIGTVNDMARQRGVGR